MHSVPQDMLNKVFASILFYSTSVFSTRFQWHNEGCKCYFCHNLLVAPVFHAVLNNALNCCFLNGNDKIFCRICKMCWLSMLKIVYFPFHLWDYFIGISSKCVFVWLKSMYLYMVYVCKHIVSYEKKNQTYPKEKGHIMTSLNSLIHCLFCCCCCNLGLKFKEKLCLC